MIRDNRRSSEAVHRTGNRKRGRHSPEDETGADETVAAHGRFPLAVNGIPVAWTDPHGATLDWTDQVDDWSVANPTNSMRP